MEHKQQETIRPMNIIGIMIQITLYILHILISFLKAEANLKACKSLIGKRHFFAGRPRVRYRSYWLSNISSFATNSSLPNNFTQLVHFIIIREHLDLIT